MLCCLHATRMQGQNKLSQLGYKFAKIFESMHNTGNEHTGSARKFTLSTIVDKVYMAVLVKVEEISLLTKRLL